MTGVTEIGAEEKREALRLALNSRAFHRAEQLKAILRYVVEADLSGRGSELTEYLIGVEVLGRPVNYSPAEDSSVRTRAYELRQKLEKLYLLEAPDAPVRIVLPKGAYAPQFEKSPAVSRPPVPEPVLPPLQIPKRPGVAVPLLIALAGIASGLFAGWLVFRTAAPSVDPVLAEAWRPFSGPNGNVILCVATPLHLTVGPATHEAAGTPTYPAPPETYAAFRQHRPLEPDAKLGLLITNNVLGVGTMNAVVASVNTLRTLGSSWQVLPERVAPISSLRSRNAILFGAPVDSEAITKVLENTPLTIAYDLSEREFVIRDRQSGKNIVSRKDSNGEFVDVYGLITVLTDRDSEHGRLGMVVFSGITSTGTHGAAEFFSSARSLQELRKQFGAGGFPAAYQIVVRCTFSNKLLLAYEYHSHRVIERQPL